MTKNAMDLAAEIHDFETVVDRIACDLQRGVRYRNVDGVLIRGANLILTFGEVKSTLPPGAADRLKSRLCAAVDRLLAELDVPVDRTPVATPPQPTAVSVAGTKILPMLAVASTNTPQSLALLRDSSFILSQKLDGQRLMVVAYKNGFHGLNRKGEIKTLYPAIAAEFEKLAANIPDSEVFVFDGELMPEGTNGNPNPQFWIFDMPQAASHVSFSTPYGARLAALQGVFSAWNPNPTVRLLPWFVQTADKTAKFDQVLVNGGEGVILRRADSPYRPGIRSHECLKVKFVKDVDVVVTRLRVNGKENLEFGVYDNGKLEVIGECTALAGDGASLRVGDVCTVRYLQWSGRRLVQPTAPRLRRDKSPQECTMDQLTIGNTKEVLV